MALRLVALQVLVCYSVLADEAPIIALLQLQLDVQEVTHGAHEHEPPAGVCKTTFLEQDMTRPIEEIVAEQDDDGWCLFGSLGEWARQCAISRQRKTVRNFVDTWWPIYQDVLTRPEATRFTFRFPDGRSLTTRDHHSPLDDVDCFVNGWLALPRGQVVNNFTFLEEVSKAFCADLERSLPEYHRISINDLHLETQADNASFQELMKSSSTSGNLTASVIHGMRLHAASKCLLGGQGPGSPGVICDIANCAASTCLGPDGELLYAVLGECPDVRA
ncbi:Uncharacterized protein SCF082_LOCUS16084 [Durusdinium trenchii]|uniref:Uncharacterized protein n=1 Tax=Durusdinium trenchii TaxID=1381693 RepID=A0ABP0K9S4_9DINO